ncbi:piwi-like protein Siwi isoform X2 [Tribolium madens]|uniref:piwi-like protein Siwi isoform X2 n=1 Tax=Tribolium madens TaxID=41895 RepID=UPI001CF73C94|nr:piwi-like protein Siwi isoform X2 [Tribolium madens]XP_044264768.1 piwi-like protein Siwi isoform X2 [Tribolium madens]XP_044264769.1 piwi-like protein Siwi isoform X2 [Tribolium madens]
MEARGKGRGFGRARGQAAAGQQQQGQQQRPGRRPGGDQGQAAPRGPPQSAWVRPAQPAASAWPRPQMGGAPQQQQPQQVAGRGERQEFDLGVTPRRVVAGEGDQGNQDGAQPATRGGASSVRGRVVRKEIIFTRPQTLVSKKGNIGTPINLLANYLPLIKQGKWCLYQYRVDMAPDVDNTSKRKGLVRTATRELLKGGYLFDGTVLYTTQRINNDSIDLFVDDNGENIRITIRLVGDVAWGDMHYIQLFNIIIRKCLALMGLQQVGRNYFMPDNKIVIQEHKIQLWPGYFTSMRQHEKDILLNVDLQFKFMRTDTVYDILLECQGANARKEFQSKIIGSVVLTHYNNKTYKIDDVDFNTTPANTFRLSDGTEVSYRDYCKKKYNVDIRVRDQPMLISRSKPREIRAGMPETVYLVPELCRMTGLTDKQRDNFNLMRMLATHTRIGVEGRIKKLMEFSQKLHSKREVVEEIRRWDLDVANSLVKFQGRVLPQEQVIGGNDARYPAGPQADWTKELRSKPMLHMPKMERLAVVCTGRNKSATQDFVQLLCKTAGGMRWSLGNPRIFDIQDDRSGTYIETIEKIANMNQPTLILVILPNNSAERYSAIKKKCCVDRGIPTQMFVARNLTTKGVMSIATKVAIQMNCKIGGAPWCVPIPLQSLMIVGYDVCRDTVNKKKSFAGIVASLDKNISRYYNICCEHKMEEELSGNFASALVILCKRWKDHNGHYPERILIYRDGVGEGQLPFVIEHEVVNIKRKLQQEIYKDGALKMAFVVVSKRINTRIFTERDNPPPGTVVDDVITLPERYDFYIVSQCVRQGTVAPTSYNVIEDSMGLPPEKLQYLTYKLTHMYYNWSGTVRVPAPCQYAHKLAFMVSQYIHRPAHPDLENILYYL